MSDRLRREYFGKEEGARARSELNQDQRRLLL